MCIGGGSAPESPDEAAVAAAQAKWNNTATQTASIMNNPNTYDPYGQTQFTVSGYEDVTNPDGTIVRVPRYNKTTTMTDAGQNLLDQKNELGDTAFSQARNSMGAGSTDGLPNWQTAYDYNNVSTDFGSNANTQGYGDFQNDWDVNRLRTNYAPEGGFSEDRRRVEDAIMSRGNELLGQNRDSEVARLAAMGMAPGSENYGRVADQFERSANDLAMQSILAGGQEQSRMLGEARNEGEFYNNARTAQTQVGSALNQMENARKMGDMAAYNQALEAYNNAILTNNSMSRDQASFNNTVRSAMYGENEASKTNDLNRLQAILTNTQINSPAIPNYAGQQVAPPDYAGMVQSNYANEVAAYNAEQAGMSSLLSGGLGLIGKFAGGF